MINTISLNNAHIDAPHTPGYSYPVIAKSMTGFSLPEPTKAHNRAQCGFFVRCLVTSIMVGWIRAPKGAPGSLVTGKANLVQFTTHKISLLSGDYINLPKRAVKMTTIPNYFYPKGTTRTHSHTPAYVYASGGAL